MITVTEQHKRWLKRLGFPVFFSVCFAVFLQWTFPSERFVPRVEAWLSDTLDREVTVEDMTLSPFGSAVLENVVIRARREEKAAAGRTQGAPAGAKKATAKKATAAPRSVYRVGRLEVSVGLWALLWGRVEVDVAGDVAGGDIAVRYSAPLASSKPKTPAAGAAAGASGDAEGSHADDRDVRLSVRIRGVRLGQVPELAALLPLPLWGTLDLSLRLDVPGGDMASARGEAVVDVRDLSLGKGQSKVEVVSGMGPMTVESIGAKVVHFEMPIADGRGTVKRVKVVSNDIDAFLEGGMRLATPLSRSRIDLYLTFKLLDGYASKSEYAQRLASLLPTVLAGARRPDGYFGYAYSGVIGKAKFVPRKFFRSGRRGVADVVRGRSAASRRPTPPAPPRPRVPAPASGSAGAPDGTSGASAPQPGARPSGGGTGANGAEDSGAQ